MKDTYHITKYNVDFNELATLTGYGERAFAFQFTLLPSADPSCSLATLFSARADSDISCALLYLTVAVILGATVIGGIFLACSLRFRRVGGGC